MKKINLFTILLAITFLFNLTINASYAQETPTPQIFGFELYESINRQKKQCAKHYGEWKQLNSHRYECADMHSGFKVNLNTDDNQQVLLMVFSFATESHGRELFYKTLNDWIKKYPQEYKTNNKTHQFNVNFWSVQFSEPRNKKGTHSIHIYDLNYLMKL